MTGSQPPGVLPLTAVVLNCTLKPSPQSSSTDVLAAEVAEAFRAEKVSTEVLRVVDHQVRFGVTIDEGDGDQWPTLRERVVAADILVLATPIWMGQPSSVAKMVLERLDAELGETDAEGRPSMFGKVAAVAVVGNEDGAHHVSAEVYQALSDVGFTIPAQAVTYWVGEAMQPVDYQEKQPRPEKTAQTTRTLTANAAHLARLLRGRNYPVPG
jgi:multimeric flavodoxin WrbA